MQANSPNNVLLQLQQAYSNLQDPKEENSTFNSPSFESLDYGEKLIVNHNILKDLISVVDGKIAARQAKKSVFMQGVAHKDKKERQKGSQRKRFEGKQDSHRLQQKLLVVRQKLKDIISFINSEAGASEKQIIKEGELGHIKQQSSHYEPSLQYSRDPSELLQISKEKGITIDKSKLQQAKEVISREVLHPFHTNRSEKSQRSEVDHDYYMKCSLQKISEVQSGQQVTEKQVKMSKDNPVSGSKDPNVSLKMHTEPQDLDETGKYILSTINKKTVSTTTINKNKKGSLSPSQPSQESSIIKEVPSCQERDSAQNSIKKNKFWLKNEKRSIQSYTKNTVVSHEQLEEMKSPSKNSFKHFPKKREQNSRNNQQLAQQHPQRAKTPKNNIKSPSKIVQNSAIQEVQSSEMIPFSYNPNLITPQSQPTNNSSLSQDNPQKQPTTLNRIQRQPTMPIPRQSRIVQEIKNPSRTGSLQRSQSMNRQMQRPLIRIAPQPTYNSPRKHSPQPRLLQERPRVIMNVPQRTESMEMRSQSPNLRSVNLQQNYNNRLPPHQTMNNIPYIPIQKQEQRVVIVPYQHNVQSPNIYRNPSPKKFNFAEQLRLIQNTNHPKTIAYHPHSLTIPSIPSRPPQPYLTSEIGPHHPRQQRERSGMQVQRREREMKGVQSRMQGENRNRSKRRGIERTYMPVS